MIDVESNKGELQILGGVELGVGAANTTGGASENARHQLFNPEDSGVIATVTTLVLGSNVTQVLHVATSNTALPTGIGTEVFRDRRRDFLTQPVCQMRTDSVLAQVDAHFAISVLANSMYTLTDENDLVILPPGSGFSLGTVSGASKLFSTFLWRERPAEQSELQF